MALRNKKFELSPRLKLGVGRGYSQNQILKISAITCLILALGLTFNAFRLIKDRGAEGSSTPQVLGATDVKQNDGKSAAQITAYTVQKGDTLFNISQKFNIDWTTLATLNNLKSPFILKSGDIINIPK
jgi:nucleoid-associated protein YgaU